jgi:hypothetical protein
MSTIDNIQSTLNHAVNEAKQFTSLYPAMVKRYGPDWTKWPKTSHWYSFLADIQAVQIAVGTLVEPPIVVPPPVISPVFGAPPVPVGKIIFQDLFEGTEIDKTKWEAKHGWHAPSGTLWNGFNNAALDGNGNLKITAKLVNGEWQSSFLAGIADNGFSYKGPRYMQVLAKIPAGIGVFPAPLWEWASSGKPEVIWGNGPIEIDVMENLGKEPKGYHTTVHPWLPTGDKPIGHYNDVGVVLSDDFHYYGAAVYSHSVDFYFDGKFIWSVDMSASGLADLTTYMVVPCIDLDMSGKGWGSPVDPNLTQAEMLVKEVTIWERL